MGILYLVQIGHKIFPPKAVTFIRYTLFLNPQRHYILLVKTKNSLFQNGIYLHEICGLLSILSFSVFQYSPNRSFNVAVQLYWNG